MSFRQEMVAGAIYQADANDFLGMLQDSSARILFLDPPFNLGKVYCEQNRSLDRKKDTAYRRWLRKVLAECARVLEPGGALFMYHLPLWSMRFGAYLESHLTFRQWIAVSMKNGFVRGTRLYPAHYALTMFTKGSGRGFARPRVPLEECRHCGEYVKDYGGYLDIVERKGVNLSDVWEDLSPVRHSKRKNRKANELPEVFYRRILEIGARRGGLFVDPFMGSGTSVIAAARFGMRFAANDILKSNCEIACKRLREFRKGNIARDNGTR